MKIVMHIPTGRLSSDYCLTDFNAFKEYLEVFGTIHLWSKYNRFTVCFDTTPNALHVTIDEFEMVEIE